MRPELFTLPGALLKLVAPLLIAWGTLSLALYALFVRGRPEALVSDEAIADDQQKSKRFRLVVDNPLNAALTIVAGLLIARYASTGAEAITHVFKWSAWTAPWKAIPLHSYGVMLGLSLVLGWNVTLPLAQKLGLARDRAADCYVVTAATAVAGSRVLYVLTNLSEFRDPVSQSLSLPAMVSLRTGGLVAYGGFLGGLLGSWLYLRSQGFSLRKWADAAVPSLALGLAVTRIGCFLFGCDFGAPLPRNAPAWLVRAGTFPRWEDGRGSPAWVQHTLDGFRVDAARCVQQFNGDFRDGLCHLGAHAHASAPVHPTQIYESLISWALLALLAWTWKRRRFDGQVLLVATMGYGLARSAIEVLRDDHERGAFGGLSTSQWIGLATAALAAVLWTRWSKDSAPVRSAVEPTPATTPEPQEPPAPEPAVSPKAAPEPPPDQVDPPAKKQRKSKVNRGKT